ncbi:molybdopterin oxidoreductase family protein [Actinoallomurus rhizosphaericola]|uniref:molybdopterin oxidoreductase family protein n=1 Tax=Actinoallomurus rhizosphaericola TaxID=2952536 RepID=UPI002093815D|nr:molybdopterin oxidoreductase family protein [Actinoallomurus rhizosphaericola]MCO5998226.1 molybdopterin oxidoreductase family protein [Actinoallomurus rhizosphaericola]
MPETTAYRICPLCEATCGLKLTITDGRVTGARGDGADVFSHGFICPKGATIGELEDDPDRLRSPMVRDGDHWREAGWDEAFAVVRRGLGEVTGRHGRQALALYLGNPNVHTLAGGLYAGPLARALGSTHLYSASTVDQMPKHVSSGLLFGDPLAIPVPDLDRTSYLLMLGANPLESNGSLCTAADFPGKLKALRRRGGTLIVVDPRRTRTARLADRHLPIRPGADAYLLFGVVRTLFTEGLVADTPGVDGVADVERLSRDFAPEDVADVCGVPAGEIRRLARELAAAPSAAVYARIGTCTAEFGTLTSWLVDVVNVLTGNLDRPGGAMFPLAPHRRPGTGSGRGFRTGRWHSRVRGLPEVRGELPATTLADEILTPGEGRVRALITVAGNPVLSLPGGERLGDAIGDLEFMVSVDPYLNETTRHAHVILPPPPPSRSPHFDIAFGDLAVRNTARYSPPAIPLRDGELDECAILARLIALVSGQDAGADVDEPVIAHLLGKAIADPSSPVHGRDPAELLPLLTGETPALRRLDLMLRLGAYGDGFGAAPGGLSLATLRDAPHGVDLGPLKPRLPEVLRTPSGRIDLCPPPLAEDVSRLRDGLARRRTGLVLIGRRHLRSNNSWLHNLPGLVRGSNRCTLQVHPEDAGRLGLADAGTAKVTGAGGTIEAEVEVTDEVMPGVVSLPHGWGHGRPGTRMSVAAAHAGVNANAVTDPLALDPLSGNAVLNGVPVEVQPT